jgi:hypothetical protein
MTLYDLAYVRDVIETDLDLKEETFITPEEIKGHVHKATREAQSLILTLYEDYFLTSANIALVAGQSAYDLPSDIFAQKIRALNYDDGSERYQVLRLKRLRDTANVDTNSLYSFLLTNAATGDQKLTLLPASRVTNPTALTIWYIRNVTLPDLDTDLVDVPEFIDYIIAQAKVYCAAKEGHPLLGAYESDAQKYKQLMIDTLSSRIIDDDNVVVMDLDHDMEST